MKKENVIFGIFLIGIAVVGYIVVKKVLEINKTIKLTSSKT
jgi:hypothetical protein